MDGRVPATDSQPPVFDAAFGAKLHALFRWRRDVRRFADTDVPPATLDALIATANLAPSVGLSEPWRFVTVDDPARRAAVRVEFTRCNADALAACAAEDMRRYASLKLAGLHEAPRQFAVFCDPDPAQGRRLGRATMPETAAYSTVTAIHTLWLAARALGLGLGWVSILDPEAMAALLDVPPAWRFIGYFCLGYPEHDSTVPELQAAGWERRTGAATIRR